MGETVRRNERDEANYGANCIIGSWISTVLICISTQLKWISLSVFKYWQRPVSPPPELRSELTNISHLYANIICYFKSSRHHQAHTLTSIHDYRELILDKLFYNYIYIRWCYGVSSVSEHFHTPPTPIWLYYRQAETFTTDYWIVTAWITEVVMIFGSVIKITFNCPIASSIVKNIPWDHIMFSDKDKKTDFLII